MSNPFRRCLQLILLLGLAVQGAEANEPSVEEKKPVANRRVDVHGDPLPPGALARLGTERWRGTHIVRAVFTADGKRLLSTGTLANLCQWDVATGKRLREDSLPEGPAGAVFSPNGEYLAWGSGAVHLWNVEKKADRRFDGSFSSQVPLAFSSDGKLLAASSRDGTVLVWDIASGEEIQKLHGETGGQINVLAFAPDARRLAGGDGKTLLSWDMSDAQAVWKSAPHTERITNMMFSPNGRMLAWGSQDRDVRLMDAATGKQVRTLDTKVRGNPLPLFSPDGKVLVVTGDGTLRTWETTSWRPLKQWRAHEHATTMIAFSPDSKTLVSAENMGRVHLLWDVATARPVSSFGGHHGAVIKVGFTADGKHILSGARGDATVLRWNLDGSGGKVLSSWQSWAIHDEGIAFSHDGTFLATGHQDRNEARLWSIAGEQEPQLLATLPDYQSVLAFSPDNRLLASVGKNNVVHLWQIPGGNERKHFCGTKEKGEQIFSMAFSPDGKALALGTVVMDMPFGMTQPKWIRFCDPRTGKLIDSLDDRMNQVFFSPDGKWLANPWGRHLWDRQARKEYHITDAPRYQFLVAFSADSRLAAWTGENALHVLELATGREVCRFQGFFAKVGSMAFSPDGRRLVAGHDDSTILIWDLTLGLTDKSSTRLSEAELEALWSELAGANAAKAYQARWRLTLAPQDTLAYIRKRQQPIAMPAVGQIEKLIADFESDQFVVRNQATRRLEQLGDLAEPALRKFADKSPTLEAQRRVESLLSKLDLPISRAERLRAVRAVAVLELIGNSEAADLLATFARGAPGALLTREAQAALVRMGK